VVVVFRWARAGTKEFWFLRMVALARKAGTSSDWVMKQGAGDGGRLGIVAGLCDGVSH